MSHGVVPPHILLYVQEKNENSGYNLDTGAHDPRAISNSAQTFRIVRKIFGSDVITREILSSRSLFWLWWLVGDKTTITIMD